MVARSRDVTWPVTLLLLPFISGAQIPSTTKQNSVIRRMWGKHRPFQVGRSMVVSAETQGCTVTRSDNEPGIDELRGRGSGRGSIERVFVGGHVPAAGLPFYSSVDGTGPPIFISRSLNLWIATAPHTHTRGLYASAWCFPIINTVHRVQWLQTTVLAPYQARYL
uniref:Uncharacterized protein n=1 Tax=Timema tahoe TaxID=61484 RepID=A0A7R9NXC5_9NEOP|nr:unnamed protein product [Timema tahoe]